MYGQALNNRGLLSIDCFHEADLSPPSDRPLSVRTSSPGSASGNSSNGYGLEAHPPLSPFRSLRTKKKLSIECPEPVRRRSTSDCNDLAFEVAEAVLNSPSASSGGSPHMGSADFRKTNVFVFPSIGEGPPSRRNSFGSSDGQPTRRSVMKPRASEDENTSPSCTPPVALDLALLETIEVCLDDDLDDDSTGADKEHPPGQEGGHSSLAKHAGNGGGNTGSGRENGADRSCVEDKRAAGSQQQASRESSKRNHSRRSKQKHSAEKTVPSESHHHEASSRNRLKGGGDSLHPPGFEASK